MGFFQKIIFSILINAGIFWLLSEKIFPEKFSVMGEPLWFAFIFVAVVFGVLNFVVKPILNILTFPIRIITLGLVAILVNAVLLWFWAEIIGFLNLDSVQIVVDGWLTFVLAGLILSVGNSVAGWFMK